MRERRVNHGKHTHKLSTRSDDVHRKTGKTYVASVHGYTHARAIATDTRTTGRAVGADMCLPVYVCVAVIVTVVVVGSVALMHGVTSAMLPFLLQPPASSASTTTGEHAMPVVVP